MKKNVLNFIGFVALFCISYNVSAQTAGTLTFKVGEVLPKASTYSGTKRVFAVWIEQNTTGTTWTYVKTLCAYGKNTPSNHIPTWKTASASNTTGVTSTSTLTWVANALQTLTWDGKNVAGTLAPDGNYRVSVEECWDHGGTGVIRVPFTKGTAAVNLTPTADTNFKSMTLVWTPTLATENFSVNPEAIVYPNPTKGVVTIDFKSDVKNIKVVDLLGKEVYNEEIKEATSSTSKRIDLSGYNDGIYFINISNENGKSTYKVLLEK